MKLELYLYIKNNNFKIGDFSKLIGCRREMLSKIMHGRAKASKMTAMAIEKATNGQITAQYLLENK